MTPDEKLDNLKEYYYSIKDCIQCGLAASRTKFVFGSGNSNAKIMFVGEAPGKNEDLQGKPFVGQAGRLLDELLDSIGYKRTEVFIANVLKCRPPQNRDPIQEEIHLCAEYLFEQIKIIDPLIVCTLGKYSTQLLLDTNEGITGLRGRVFRSGSRYILPINHPAAALYAPSRFGILKNDFSRIEKVMGVIKTGKSDNLINIEFCSNSIIEEKPMIAKKDLKTKEIFTVEEKDLNIEKNIKENNFQSEQMGLFK
ncbi:MAG: uracil-DNA glycosylase [Actinomycetota bacterium]